METAENIEKKKMMSAGKPNLFKAMSKFRTQLKQPKLDGDNPFFESGYVTLEGVQKAVDEALKGTGLSYIQKVYNDGNGGVGVETVIMHEDGEVLSSGQLSLRPTRNDPQGYGSAITYAKRYQLAAMFGISSDKDDDGNAASQPQQQQAPQITPLQAEYQRLMTKLVKQLNGDKKRAEDLVNSVLGEGKHSGKEYVNAVKGLLESEEQK